jgi:molybdate-binding protein/DNA-binding XRE family transcriptional regulator
MGLSQRALAEAAGVSRQAVSAIESGRMQPSVGIALDLARALGVTVEALFGAPPAPQATPSRVASATIGGRVVTHRLQGADHLAIEPAETAGATAFVAGCDFAAGLLARHATLRSREVRALWLPMTNRAALAALRRGQVHAALIHSKLFPKAGSDAGLVAYELATTEEGWLVSRGNPLRLCGATDLIRKKARLVNRPPGAGARTLLDEQLRRAGVDVRRVAGYRHSVPGQLDAGRAIAQGFADAAIGMAGVAPVFGLDFIPLCEERCSLVVRRSELGTPAGRMLLDALRGPGFRRDLQALRAYDVTRTGEEIA